MPLRGAQSGKSESRQTWENLEAQSLLGLEGFAEALKDHVAGKQKLRGGAESATLDGRVSLKRLFEKSDGKVKRDRRIREAVYKHGYCQIEVARHLELHYSIVSRLINSTTKEQE